MAGGILGGVGNSLLVASFGVADAGVLGVSCVGERANRRGADAAGHSAGVPSRCSGGIDVSMVIVSLLLPRSARTLSRDTRRDPPGRCMRDSRRWMVMAARGSMRLCQCRSVGRD